MTIVEKITPYLPYDINVGQPYCGKIEAYNLYGISFYGWADEWTVHMDDSRHGDYQRVYLKGVKPILKPMKDIFNSEHKHVLNNLSETDLETIKTVYFNNPQTTNKFNLLSIHVYNLLIKNHFDIFNMIDDELAYNINKIK